MNTDFNNSYRLNAFGTAGCRFQIYSVPDDINDNSDSLISRNSNSNKCNNNDTQYQLTVKSPELKFKIESVGIHPENDDDLAMCPSRTRPFWPKKVVSWWVATYPKEKPPFSYATLIAHAILSSKDGRLTLHGIYTWLSRHYPAFTIGKGGWQNSIRHNLSLNKKWFYKIDRRPTQANPGKGSYWTLVVGTEQIFIDNLTHEGGHSRMQHDIGLTAEILISGRRGTCYYKGNIPKTLSATRQQQTLINDSSDTSDFATPPPKLTKPLYTTFKMVNMAEKMYSQQNSSFSTSSDLTDDSDNDSGIDVGSGFVDMKHLCKRRRTNIKKSRPSSSLAIPESQPSQQLHLSTSMTYDTPTSIGFSSLGLNADNANFELNNWVEHSLVNTECQLPVSNNSQCQWRSITHTSSPVASGDSFWCASNAFQEHSTLTASNRKRYPITINLDDEEVTQKYLLLEEEEDCTQYFNTSIVPLTNHEHVSSYMRNINISMPSPVHCNSYPHPPSMTISTPIPSTTNYSTCNTFNNVNSTSLPFPSASLSAPIPRSEFYQYVAMQDILFS